MYGFDYSDFVAQIARGGARDVHLKASSLAILLSAIASMRGQDRWHVSGDELSVAEYDVVENWLDLAVFDLLTEITSGGSGSALVYANLAYIVEAGSSGGSSVATTWTQYPINTIVADENEIITLADNRFQIAEGTFFFNIESALRMPTGGGRLGLYNVTQAMPVKVGANQHSDNAVVRGADVSNGSDYYEVQYYVETANNGDGLGRKIDSGEDELYLDVNLYYQE